VARRLAVYFVDAPHNVAGNAPRTYRNQRSKKSHKKTALARVPASQGRTSLRHAEET
jgi:hypothetical protein